MGKLMHTALLAFLFSTQAVWAEEAAAPWPGFAGAFLSSYIAERQGDWQAVNTHLETLTALDPGNRDLLHRLAFVQLNAGHFPAAVEQAEALLQITPTAHLAQILVFSAAIQRDDLAKAHDILDGMTTEGMGQYIKPFLAAWLSGNFRQAETALKPIAEIASLRSLYQLQLALLGDFFGKPEKADAAYLQAANTYPSYHVVELAISHFLRRNMPRKVTALLTAAGDGTIDDNLLDSLSRTTATKSVASISDGLAEVFYGLSILLQAEGASDVALPYLRVALALKPEFPVAQILVGDLLVRSARYQEASQLFSAVRTDRSWGAQAALRAGVLETVTGDLTKATQNLSELAAAHDHWAEAWQQLGDARLAKGDLAGAIDAFTYELTLGKYHLSNEERGRALMSRAQALQRQQNLHAAETDLQEAVQLMPDNAQLLNHLGYMWAERGVRLDEAADLVTRAMRADPNNGNILDSLGFIRTRQGNLGEAVRLLELASEVLPYDPVVNNHLGDAYWAAGRRTEARFQWHRSLVYRDSPGPDVISIDALRAKLERGPGVSTAQTSLSQ